MRTALNNHGFHCDSFTIAGTMLEALRTGTTPDLFILDYHLGVASQTGLTLCRTLRLHHQRPVIILTANQDARTVVSCLNAGAEEYIRKPCETEELVARIHVVLRRVAQTASADGATMLTGLQRAGTTLALDRLRLDTNDRRVSWNDVESSSHTELTEKELQLLELLVSAPDHTVSRADAFFELYNYNMEPENRSIDVLIARLRRRLRDINAGIKIQTLRGVGYRITATARIEEDNTERD